jgi:uncharacterized membrane protein YqjE
MATQQHPIHRGDGRRSTRILAPAPEPPVGDLIRQLGTDGAGLVRNEIALAKLEIREMARDIALDSARLFAALTIALAGVLALLTAGIVALGNALDGRYALAALIAGVIMLAIGALLARSGIAGLKRAPKPDQTVATLKSTSHWVKEEINDFKQEIRS